MPLSVISTSSFVPGSFVEPPWAYGPPDGGSRSPRSAASLSPRPRPPYALDRDRTEAEFTRSAARSHSGRSERSGREAAGRSGRGDARRSSRSGAGRAASSVSHSPAPPWERHEEVFRGVKRFPRGNDEEPWAPSPRGQSPICPDSRAADAWSLGGCQQSFAHASRTPHPRPLNKPDWRFDVSPVEERASRMLNVAHRAHGSCNSARLQLRDHQEAFGGRAGAAAGLDSERRQLVDYRNHDERRLDNVLPPPMRRDLRFVKCNQSLARPDHDVDRTYEEDQRRHAEFTAGLAGDYYREANALADKRPLVRHRDDKTLHRGMSGTAPRPLHHDITGYDRAGVPTYDPYDEAKPLVSYETWRHSAAAGWVPDENTSVRANLADTLADDGVAGRVCKSWRFGDRKMLQNGEMHAPPYKNNAKTIMYGDDAGFGTTPEPHPPYALHGRAGVHTDRSYDASPRDAGIRHLGVRAQSNVSINFNGSPAALSAADHVRALDASGVPGAKVPCAGESSDKAQRVMHRFHIEGEGGYQGLLGRRVRSQCELQAPSGHRSPHACSISLAHSAASGPATPRSSSRRPSRSLTPPRSARATPRSAAPGAKASAARSSKTPRAAKAAAPGTQRRSAVGAGGARVTPRRGSGGGASTPRRGKQRSASLR
eukprot:TRINITY_DN12063_c0_g1_i2.p1 TRINITY_DN12063_c0_g1~~TRINITY_DN12063_c0_g1_i2.p1  ORF type:complete len:655 (-),score=101.94 TRINITY_DN12063_c0_g1_i2:142-2106(-)